MGYPSGFVSLTDYRAKESGPAVRVVDPGKYRILAGRCITYELLDKSDAIKTAMKAGEMGEGLDEIADRMVFKQPMKVMDKAEYEAAILRAYSKTPDGKTPTKDQVDERFSEEMKIAAENSLKKVAGQLGLSERAIEDMLKVKVEDKT